jgi:Zn-dependent alcohol dehydrogenase
MRRGTLVSVVEIRGLAGFGISVVGAVAVDARLSYAVNRISNRGSKATTVGSTKPPTMGLIWW